MAKEWHLEDLVLNIQHVKAPLQRQLHKALRITIRYKWDAEHHHTKQSRFEYKGCVCEF